MIICIQRVYIVGKGYLLSENPSTLPSPFFFFRVCINSLKNFEQFADIKNKLSKISFLFKNYLLVEVMYLLIRLSKSKLFP